MQFRRQLRAEDAINLTPLIDVVFLLLIFFMVSTTFTKESHLSINLPEASGDPQAERPEDVVILINADGSYAVNGRALVNAELITLLSALDTVNPENTAENTPIIITADANSSHESVVRAMDAAGQAGFVQLSITTRNASID